MARNPQPPRQSDSDHDLDVSSLIDVSFLLLIFFLVSSTLLKRETDLGMLIGRGETPVDPAVPLEIAIAADGRIIMGGQELAGPSVPGEPSQITKIRDELKEHKTRADLIGEDALVSLDAAGGAGTQRFIDVINALSFAGIEHIALVDGPAGQ